MPAITAPLAHDHMEQASPIPSLLGQVQSPQDDEASLVSCYTKRLATYGPSPEATAPSALYCSKLK